MSSTLSTAQTVFGTAFVSIFAAKYTKTFVGCYTYMTFKPRPIQDKPKYTAADVSVVIPTTYDEPLALAECVARIVGTNPAKVFIVCPDEHVLNCKALLDDAAFECVTVIGVEKMNKRVQILNALDYIKTDIIVLADDDVFWPCSQYLNYLLAVFEDDRVGAGGTRQRVRRDQNPNFWNFWGIGYLERRVWNNATTNAIDGSISTLSGRTAAYRSEILQTDEFAHYFANDSWRGKPLNSDDDKCLTRYVYRKGWKISIQFDPRSVLETTVENGPKYIHQCMRWARAHWRGNTTVMENETYWRSKEMLWGMYVIYFGSYLTPAILWETVMWVLLWLTVRNTSWAMSAFITYGAVIFFTKLVKYIPHFMRHPQDLKFIFHAIAFSYYHGALNVYAGFTMTTTHWGSRTGVDGGNVSAARELMESDWVSQHAVELATPGQASRFSVNGRDHFRVTQPGSAVMSKEDVKKFEAQRAKDEESAIAKANEAQRVKDEESAIAKAKSADGVVKLIDDTVENPAVENSSDGVVKLVDDTIEALDKSPDGIVKLIDDTTEESAQDNSAAGLVNLIDESTNGAQDNSATGLVKLVDDTVEQPANGTRPCACPVLNGVWTCLCERI